MFFLKILEYQMKILDFQPILQDFQQKSKLFELSDIERAMYVYFQDMFQDTIFTAYKLNFLPPVKKLWNDYLKNNVGYVTIKTSPTQTGRKLLHTDSLPLGPKIHCKVCEPTRL